MPVAVSMKPWAVQYWPLTLRWHPVNPTAGAACSLVSSRGALPVYAVLQAPLPIPGAPPIPILRHVADSVAVARLDFFNQGRIHVPACDWAHVTRDCSLSGSGPLMVRWHTDGFDEQVPITHHSFWNSGPLTYYIAASTDDIRGGLQDLEAKIHTTLIAHLPEVETIAVVQEPPADVRVRNSAGDVTGRTAGGGVASRIRHARYVSNGRGYAAVVLAEPDAGPYRVTVIGRPKHRYSLSESAITPSGLGANGVVAVTRVGVLGPRGTRTFQFVPRAAYLPRISGHRNVVAYARRRRRVRVPYAPPSARDDNGRRVPVACVPKSRSWFRVGATKVNCIARDPFGPVARSTFFVVVRL